MATAFPVVGYNEEIPLLSGTFTPVSGTITLSAVTVTLRDNQRAIVAGFPVAATAFTSGASATPYASFTFSPSELGLPEPATQDYYSLEFDATDTLENTYASVQTVIVKPKGV